MYDRLTPEMEHKIIYVNKKDMTKKFFKDLCNNEDKIYEIATLLMYDLVRSGRIKNNIPIIKR